MICAIRDGRGGDAADAAHLAYDIARPAPMRTPAGRHSHFLETAGVGASRRWDAGC